MSKKWLLWTGEEEQGERVSSTYIARKYSRRCSLISDKRNTLLVLLLLSRLLFSLSLSILLLSFFFYIIFIPPFFCYFTMLSKNRFNLIRIKASSLKASSTLTSTDEEYKKLSPVPFVSFVDFHGVGIRNWGRTSLISSWTLDRIDWKFVCYCYVVFNPTLLGNNCQRDNYKFFRAFDVVYFNYFNYYKIKK